MTRAAVSAFAIALGSAPALTDKDSIPKGASATGGDLRPLPLPEIFAFLGSGSLLVLEIVAARIIAPNVGVSLYTWTSVIGVVLAGLALGNWLGGKVADTRPGRTTLSALYLGAVGVALMLLPLQFGVGAVPPDASPQLIALLRLLGGPFLGIAVLNWLSRNAPPSATLNAVLLANIVGFGTVAANDVWGVFSGEARELAKIFLPIHLLFTLAFIAAARASWRRA